MKLKLKEKREKAKREKQKKIRELKTLTEDQLYEKMKKKFERKKELLRERDKIDKEDCNLDYEINLIDNLTASEDKYDYQRFADLCNSQ